MGRYLPGRTNNAEIFAARIGSSVTSTECSNDGAWSILAANLSVEDEVFCSYLTLVYPITKCPIWVAFGQKCQSVTFNISPIIWLNKIICYSQYCRDLQIRISSV